MSRIDTVSTIAPVRPVADDAPGYRIQHGDTLSQIAAAHGTTVDALMRANPQIRDADLIYAGDTLRIPEGRELPHSGREAPTIQPGETLSRLARESPVSRSELISGITEADYAATARQLGVDVAAIKAVAQVESAGSGMLASGKPKILFEAHVFHAQTNGRFDASQPNLSSPGWNRSLYGAGGEHQWDRFDRAAALDPQAAMQSASWGRFQIMGFNHQRAGFSNVQDFVAAMKSGEGAQLQAFASFIQSDPKMLQSLRDHDWAGFAQRYNGAGYAQNQYDTKIAAAFARYAH